MLHAIPLPNLKPHSTFILLVLWISVQYSTKDGKLSHYCSLTKLLIFGVIKNSFSVNACGLCLKNKMANMAKIDQS